jgi:hypothetical protein
MHWLRRGVQISAWYFEITEINPVVAAGSGIGVDNDVRVRGEDPF